MTKATQTLSYTLAFFAVWATLLSNIIPLPPQLHEILPILPLWILVSFGAYLLATLGWNIFTFKDKEDAYRSLLKEIEVAKADLKSQGVTID